MSSRLAEAQVRRQRLRARHFAGDSPSALRSTVEALACFGEKRVGTDGGARAGAYLHDRLLGAGLDDVRFEEFGFLRHDVRSASLRFELGKHARLGPDFDVLEGCAAGDVDAPLVYAGTATPDELAGLELNGKVALVERSSFFHRSSQLDNVARAGALALVAVAQADGNLRQVGSVRRGFEKHTALPAVVVGAQDGARLLHALTVGPVVAHVHVDASHTASTGANVVARLPGSDERHGKIVIGAHYDTWFLGSTDNGGGVAALLALAERWAARDRPRFALELVLFDGEEIALYGGYHWLRRHSQADEPVLAVIDLETPAALGAGFGGVACGGCACLDQALRHGELDRLYNAFLPMNLVPKLFGGVVPTDVQGAYRRGMPTASTAVDAPWYHTTADTPDKLDAERLSAIVRGFDRAIEKLMASDPTGKTVDADLWSIDSQRRAGALSFRVHDADARPVANANVTVHLLRDGFHSIGTLSGTTDAAGGVDILLPDPSSLGDNAWGLVEAASDYPRAETIVELTGSR